MSRGSRMRWGQGVGVLSLAVSLAACGGGGAGEGNSSSLAQTSTSGDAQAAAADAQAVARSARVAGTVTKDPTADGWQSGYSNLSYMLATGMSSLPEGSRPDFDHDIEDTVIAVWQFNCRVWAGRMDEPSGVWSGVTPIDGGPWTVVEPEAPCVTSPPVVDARPDGTAVAIWSRTEGADPAGPARLISARLEGGRWTAAPVELPAALRDIWGLAIASDGAGGSVMAFIARDDQNPIAGYSLYLGNTTGSGWSTLESTRIGPIARGRSMAPTLTTDENGSVHLGFLQGNQIGPYTVLTYPMYRRKPQGQPWGAAQMISNGSIYGAQDLQLGVDESGRVSATHTLTQTEAGAPRYSEVLLLSVPADGVIVPGGNEVVDGSLTAPPAYRFLVEPYQGRKWYINHGRTGDPGAALTARHRAAGATDWSLETLAPAGGGFRDLEAAIDGDGNVLVTYVSDFADGSPGAIYASRWQETLGAWGAREVFWPGAGDCTSGSHRLKTYLPGRSLFMCGVVFYSGDGIGYAPRAMRHIVQ